MKTLIVVDMQNDFIDGALGTPEARAIVPNVKKKIEEYRERGDVIIFTRDTHYASYLDTMEGKKLPVKHCIKGTRGWDIANEFNVVSDKELIIDKTTFGFIGWHWYSSSFVVENSSDGIKFVDEIELVGLCTDICVISNAMILKAIYPEIPIVVDASCCAGVTPESHKNALEAMKMCQIEIRGE